MPVPEKFAAQVEALPDAPGVYLYRDAAGNELYVGKAKSLRKRVRQYFDASRPADPKTAALLRRLASIDYLECESEVEAYLLENRLIKDLQPPYNVQAKSDVNFPLVEVTWDESFPRVRVTRDRSRKGSVFYGPFVAGFRLREALRILQRAFPHRTCALELGADDRERRRRRPCLEHFIHRCPAPCAGRVSSSAYRETLRRLVLFLHGKGREVREELDREMKAAARERRYEDAASLRDILRALESLRRRGGLSEDLEPGVLHLDPRAAVADLQSALGLPSPPRRVEGLDVAHLQGREAVGALVTFLDGQPARDGYRRFRLRGAGWPGAEAAEAKAVAQRDDCASLREVVARRYTRLAREGRPLPDLVLIDGGPAQLRSAREALRAERLPLPCLAALAKQEEVIYTMEHPKGLRLPRRSPALRLLQFVRDEAHRFAQHYHHLLRRKRVLEEA
jgi:excinuclease ABC subunit C